MKYGVIDIGSNSVRLLLWADGSSIRKSVYTTRLAEGISFQPDLLPQAMERSIEAIEDCILQSKQFGVDKLFAFATAAVRGARNGGEFVQKVYDRLHIQIEVLSGQDEAIAGFYGALQGKDGGIIDIGGASTEITVGKDGKIIYAVSANIGAVRLKDKCGENRNKLLEYIEQEIAVYGNIPICPFTVIGGTATSIAALEYEAEPYDPKKIHGKVLTLENIEGWADKLLALSLEDRLQLKGMDRRRADILGGGALLLYCILKKIGCNSVFVSENDSMEGYLLYKLQEERR